MRLGTSLSVGMPEFSQGVCMRLAKQRWQPFWFCVARASGGSARAKRLQESEWHGPDSQVFVLRRGQAHQPGHQD